ncbi:MAG: hypothetical protein A2008_01735 [Candidatus Wallbacteria bacterium GWC2_49_35]|uniref:Glycosyl transferase family 1 n=1 Tax=Candidatus Wallbacteria bacterium GWC2_49_35 TaxID=1817813 RepID=A0A1F7WSY6_9BACT|nr:MAG: hypothetical protein A2008_01735 [Candidatus Wallbacteria bacterium GWC2_49_35]HBC76077.1 glycosyltransferase family 1 protein [Candidatus Wallbacteria bacterium]
MKILYDHQIFEAQVYGGVSRYFYELMRCFHAGGRQDIEFDLPLACSNNHYIKDAPFLKRKCKRIIHFDNFIVDFNFKGKWKLYQLAQKIGYVKNYTGINKALSVESIKKQDFDIFHPTYYSSYFLEHIGQKPFVLTVYDMIHELFPAEYPGGDKFLELKKLMIEKAARVIAISESTKRDIVRLYGGKFEEKIDVVYLGNSLDASNAETGGLKTPEKYLLFVGSRSKYKNFIFFVESVVSILKRDPELKIVCAGGGAFSETELAFFNKLGLGGRFSQYSLDDGTLAHLYKKALAFVFPSLYEGFGIPVLESFAAGCPLIVSDSSSLPEVAGDACVYIDSADGASIAGAVEKVIGSAQLRSQLIAKGYEQLKKFSWEITAEKTKKIYEEILR